MLRARFASLAIVFSAVLAIFSSQSVDAQIVLGVVGGVKIDAEGVLESGYQTIDPQVMAEVQRTLAKADGDIESSTSLRMVSLRGLEAAINQAHVDGQPYSAEVRYVAGLQRIEFIVVSPETGDIILAGPAEGWKLNESGSVVGETTNRPVIHLEDLLVAFRTSEQARTGQGISVSIDPSQQGIQKLARLYKEIGRQGGFNPSFQPNVEQALGNHDIRLTGVPEDTRFAHVLVAADYKMKRIAMGLEPSPLKALPSMLELAANAGASKMKSSPRFWMECNYQPVAKSEDSKVWQIRGQGVKTLTEESRYNEAGQRSAASKTNRLAEQWASLMTEHFDELATADPTFGEVRNAMDMSVVAALIDREQLLQRAGLEIPAILGLTEAATTPAWTVPKKVPTQCSFVQIARSWLITASGGVQLDSWSAASNIEVDPAVGKVADIALNRTADRWWWNSEN